MKSKLLKRISLIAVVLLLLVVVTSPVTTLWLIKRQSTRIVSDSLYGLSTSSLATVHVSEGFLGTAVAVYGGDLQRKALDEQLDKTNLLIDAQYEAHRETLQTDQERSAFEKMIRCRKDYRATREAVIRLLKAGKTEDAQKLFEHECVVKFESYTKALGKLVEHNASEARERGAEIIRLCRGLLVLQVLFLLFFFIYGFFVPLTAFLERLSRRPVDLQD